jgi:hypothetical protein
MKKPTTPKAKLETEMDVLHAIRSLLGIIIEQNDEALAQARTAWTEARALHGNDMGEWRASNARLFARRAGVWARIKAWWAQA